VVIAFLGIIGTKINSPTPLPKDDLSEYDPGGSLNFQRTLYLNISNSDFIKKDVDIYRSSNYYPNMKYPKSLKVFLTEFKDHKFVRTNRFDMGIFFTHCGPETGFYKYDPNPDYSSCVNRFREVISEELAVWGYMLNTTDNFIVHLGSVPLWLSTSDNESLSGGSQPEYQGHQPRDYKVWREMLEIMDEVVVESGFPSSQIYYEFYNEPDLVWHKDNLIRKCIKRHLIPIYIKIFFLRVTFSPNSTLP